MDILMILYFLGIEVYCWIEGTLFASFKYVPRSSFLVGGLLQESP